MSNAVRLLSVAEFRQYEEQRMELARKRGADPNWLKANNSVYGWARIDEVAGPCVMWYCPWYYDPTDAGDIPKRERALDRIKNGTFDKTSYYLSKHYWSDWSDKRPPLAVLTPNGKEWCVDAISNNGDGWKVTGEPPRITCKPSIMVPGYHGFLTEGVFSNG